MTASEPGVQFQRINLVVADLERSLAIYRDILGFTVDYQKTSAPDSYSYTVFGFPPEAQLRFCTLNAPDQVRTPALTEVTGCVLAPPVRPSPAAMVVRLADMDSVLDALGRCESAHLFLERTLHTQDGRTGREVGLLDPDGHLSVLFTITRAAG